MLLQKKINFPKTSHYYLMKTDFQRINRGIDLQSRSLKETTI
jgi:hypothetical protein